MHRFAVILKSVFSQLVIQNLRKDVHINLVFCRIISDVVKVVLLIQLKLFKMFSTSVGEFFIWDKQVAH